MGYWPSKLCALLNIFIMLGYGMVDCIVGGQVLSAVSGGGMSVIVGVIIIAIVTWAVVLFGMQLFHIYERYASKTALYSTRYALVLTRISDGPGSLS